MPGTKTAFEKDAKAHKPERPSDRRSSWKTPLGIIKVILAIEFVAFSYAFAAGVVPKSLEEFVRLLVIGPIIVIIAGSIEALLSGKGKS